MTVGLKIIELGEETIIQNVYIQMQLSPDDEWKTNICLWMLRLGQAFLW
jgi:hypothetical protein